jgi:hypothetical protein
VSRGGEKGIGRVGDGGRGREFGLEERRPSRIIGAWRWVAVFRGGATDSVDARGLMRRVGMIDAGANGEATFGCSTLFNLLHC